MRSARIAFIAAAVLTLVVSVVGVLASSVYEPRLVRGFAWGPLNVVIMVVIRVVGGWWWRRFKPGLPAARLERDLAVLEWVFAGVLLLQLGFLQLIALSIVAVRASVGSALLR